MTKISSQMIDRVGLEILHHAVEARLSAGPDRLVVRVEVLDEERADREDAGQGVEATRTKWPRSRRASPEGAAAAAASSVNSWAMSGL